MVTPRMDLSYARTIANIAVHELDLLWPGGILPDIKNFDALTPGASRRRAIRLPKKNRTRL